MRYARTGEHERQARYLSLAFLLHVFVGVAAIGTLLWSSALQGWEGLFVFVVGVPWVAGLLAFFGWPRAMSKFAFILPTATVIVTAAILLLAEFVAGLS
jgi:hypothetical protein